MKKNYILFILLIVGSMNFISCSNDSEEQIESSHNISLKSNVSSREFNSIVSSINLKMDNVRSSGDIDFSEDDAKIILKPLIEDGRELHKSLLKRVDLSDEGLSDEEIDDIQNMTDDELAAFSFIVYSLGQQSDSRAVVSQRVMSCLSAAVGITAIRELGISGIVNATTITRALIAIGKRYLGYIGVALMVYSFVDCVS